MASVLKDIFALEEQHRCGCLSDLEFAAAVAAVLPDTADNAAQHPVWLTAVANEVAQLDA